MSRKQIKLMYPKMAGKGKVHAVNANYDCDACGTIMHREYYEKRVGDSSDVTCKACRKFVEKGGVK